MAKTCNGWHEGHSSIAVPHDGPMTCVVCGLRVKEIAPEPSPAPAMPKCVAELVEVMHSAYLAKFPELCGTRVEDRINAAIASVRAYYGSKP